MHEKKFPAPMMRARLSILIRVCYVALSLARSAAADEEASLQQLAAASPFLRSSSDEVYLKTVTCPDRRATWESNPTYDIMKIEGVSAKDAQPIGSAFMRANGKIYDAYLASFVRMGSDRTNNLGNKIDVATFSLIDAAGGEYYRDKNGIYFYKRYPTSGACILPGHPDWSHSPERNENLFLQEIVLSSPKERVLYESHKPRIKIQGSIPYPTEYASLDGTLYWRRIGHAHSTASDGQFRQVPGVDPKSLKPLISAKFFLGVHEQPFTDGRQVILNGQIAEIDPRTFQLVTWTMKGGMKQWSCFFKANDSVYYFSTCAPAAGEREESAFVKTDADPATFEAINTSGNWSGLVTRDKAYSYAYDPQTKQLMKHPRQDFSGN